MDSLDPTIRDALVKRLAGRWSLSSHKDERDVGLVWEWGHPGREGYERRTFWVPAKTMKLSPDHIADVVVSIVHCRSEMIG